ncbi:MAG TPA: hypothetical protein VMS17_22970 [Gemmataceae bacterium]|nr:hypothetical protein [Gemmataceae bacterium]
MSILGPLLEFLAGVLAADDRPIARRLTIGRGLLLILVLGGFSIWLLLK